MTDFNHTNILKQIEQSDLHESSTKPLYFSKVTIEGDNSLSPLSDSLYRSILTRALNNPLQNIDSSLATFQDIKRSFLYTGLYQDVSVSFEKDLNKTSEEFLRTNVPSEYGIELPIATHAKVLLKPSTVYNTNAASTTLKDDFASLAVCRTWMNQLGFADSEMLYYAINYNPIKSALDGVTSKGSFSIPFAKDTSIRGLIDFEYNEIYGGSDSKDCDNVVSMGFQKSLILEKTKSVPTFYTGLSFTSRFSKGKHNKQAPENDFLLKTAVTSQFKHDTRKFFGNLPVSGHLLKVNNEYVISQSDTASLADSVDNGFNKLQIDFEQHASFFKNMLTRSLNVQLGGIIPTGEIENIHVADRVSFDGTNVMRGFQPNGIGLGRNNFYYKMGLNTSHKLFNSPLDSPLRLNCFLNLGNSFNEFTNAIDSFAASTGLSLIYKTPQADMDLTYAYPLSTRPQDLSKPGFSFGIKFSYF